MTKSTIARPIGPMFEGWTIPENAYIKGEIVRLKALYLELTRRERLSSPPPNESWARVERYFQEAILAVAAWKKVCCPPHTDTTVNGCCTRCGKLLKN